MFFFFLILNCFTSPFDCLTFFIKLTVKISCHWCLQDDLDRLSPKRRYGYRTVLATRCRPEEEAVSVDSMRLSKDQQIKPEGTVQFQSDARGAGSTESLGKKTRA